jgi:septum formation protein
MGIPFEARPSGADELTEGDPREVALENARRKAAAVAADVPVLAVDTLVALDGRIYGQPAGDEEARATLRALSGRTHTVVSGVVLTDPVRAAGGHLARDEGVEETAVTFRDLSDADVDWYVATGEWRGRAGGYAIQERGAALVRRIDGDYLNVVGLPLALLLDVPRFAAVFPP